MTEFEKHLEETKKNKKDDEVICYAFNVGKLIPNIFNRRAMKKRLDLITSCDGFIGLHPVDFNNVLVVIDTLNNAKASRNVLKESIKVSQIEPVLVKECDL